MPSTDEEGTEAALEPEYNQVIRGIALSSAADRGPIFMKLYNRRHKIPDTRRPAMRRPVSTRLRAKKGASIGELFAEAAKYLPIRRKFWRNPKEHVLRTHDDGNAMHNTQKSDIEGHKTDIPRRRQ
jgi:hypothetical protein